MAVVTVADASGCGRRPWLCWHARVTWKPVGAGRGDFTFTKLNRHPNRECIRGAYALSRPHVSVLPVSLEHGVSVTQEARATGFSSAVTLRCNIQNNYRKQLEHGSRVTTEPATKHLVSGSSTLN